jgi:hypothetical protein
MKITKRMLTGLGAIALAVSLLILVAPKAAHAVVVTLVQVANTSANPAITQDVSRLASQSVQLVCVSINNCAQILPDGSTPDQWYTVPAGSHLVITTVQINTSGTPSTQLMQSTGAGNVTRGSWTLDTAGSFLFQYPSGIVFSSGSVFYMNFQQGQTYLSGYIVSN